MGEVRIGWGWIREGLEGMETDVESLGYGKEGLAGGWLGPGGGGVLPL